jgi:hypothetical protein
MAEGKEEGCASVGDVGTQRAGQRDEINESLRTNDLVSDSVLAGISEQGANSASHQACTVLPDIKIGLDMVVLEVPTTDRGHVNTESSNKGTLDSMVGTARTVADSVCLGAFFLKKAKSKLKRTSPALVGAAPSVLKEASHTPMIAVEAGGDSEEHVVVCPVEETDQMSTSTYCNAKTPQIEQMPSPLRADAATGRIDRRFQGVVKFFKGSFGWVTCQEVAVLYEGRDTFVHKGDCDTNLRRGDAISFSLTVDASGNPKALDLRKEVPFQPVLPPDTPVVESAHEWFRKRDSLRRKNKSPLASQ